MNWCFGNSIMAFAALIAASFSLNASEYAPLIRWNAPSIWESGASLDPATDLSEFRLYCNMEVESPQTFSISEPFEWQSEIGFFPPGIPVLCHMTAVAITGEESDPGPTVEITATPDKPAVVIFTIE